MSDSTSVKEQLISDIKLLPDHTLKAISIIVREIVMINSGEKSVENADVSLSKAELLRRWNEVKSGQGVILTQEEFESQCEVDD